MQVAVIQIEEPLIHLLAAAETRSNRFVDFLVEAFNHEVEGLDGVEVWVHCCWGNPNMQRTTERRSYANSMEMYLDRLKADVWAVEMSDDNYRDLDFFRRRKGRLKKKMALGVVSHRTLQVETPEEIADRIRFATRFIDAEDLILSPNCGFGRQGANRLIALYKSAATTQGANIVRREFGLSERPVPVTDPALQPDVLEPTVQRRP